MDILPSQSDGRQCFKEGIGILPVAQKIFAKRPRRVSSETELARARRRFDARIRVNALDRPPFDQIESLISSLNETGEDIDRMRFGRNLGRTDSGRKQSSQHLNVEPFEIDLDVARLSIFTDDVRGMTCLDLNAAEVDGDRLVGLAKLA